MEQEIKSLPCEEYHNGEGYSEYLSSSQLKHYLVSPKCAKMMLDHPELEEETPYKAFGTLYHGALQALAEGKSLAQWRGGFLKFDTPVNPKTGKPYGKDTAKYAEALAAAMAENPGKAQASEEDLCAVEQMVGALLGSENGEVLNECLGEMDAEPSFFLEHRGCKFKYRPDLYSPIRMIDWKTTSSKSLTEQAVNSAIVKFGYHISAAFYQYFEHERTGKWLPFYWVFQSTEPPYDSVMVSAELWAYSATGLGVDKGPGAMAFESLLEQHLYCMESGEWKGAEIAVPKQGRGRVMVAQPPQWEYYKIPTFYND